MIKINLLPREARKRRAVPALAMPRISLREGLAIPLLAAIFLIEVVGVGAWLFVKKRQADAALARIAVLKQEDAQLKAELKDQEVVEAARRDIQSRVEIIGRVARTQGLPVQMLSGVLRSVPEGLWLTAFEVKPREVKTKVQRPAGTRVGVLERLEKRQEVLQTKEGQPEFIEVIEVQGFSVVLKGSAFGITQVADFIDNLSRLGVFSEVDFLATRQGLVEQTKVMNFELTASVSL